jgi:hypothetical protein
MIKISNKVFFSFEIYKKEKGYLDFFILLLN